MAGGIYSTTNKVLPGAYVNVKAVKSNIMAQSGVRGVVFTVLQGLGWGTDGVEEVTLEKDIKSLFGHDLLDPKLVGLRMILNNAHKAIVFNVNPGTPAAATSTALPWSFEAKYNGEAGNTIAVTVAPDGNHPGKFNVTTTYGTQLVDKQSVGKASELVANGYVVPTVVEASVADDGVAMLTALTAPVSVKLAGGTTVLGSDTTTNLQTALETYDYNTLVAAGAADDSPLHGLFATVARRLRDDQGRKVQAVVPAKAEVNADYEGVIEVGNAIVMTDGTQLTQSQTAAFIAGATAAAEPNESLTYRAIPDAQDVVPRFTDEEAINQIGQGHLILTVQRGTVKVLEDINSLHTFGEGKSRDFSKNRPLRVLDDIANRIKLTWEDNFVGKITNDAAGRDLLKATIVEYLTTLQAQHALEDFKSDTDINVRPGGDKDSVLVDVSVMPTDSMEKLYMEVTTR